MHGRAIQSTAPRRSAAALRASAEVGAGECRHAADRHGAAPHSPRNSRHDAGADQPETERCHRDATTSPAQARSGKGGRQSDGWSRFSAAPPTPSTAMPDACQRQRCPEASRGNDVTAGNAGAGLQAYRESRPPARCAGSGKRARALELAHSASSSRKASRASSPKLGRAPPQAGIGQAHRLELLARQGNDVPRTPGRGAGRAPRRDRSGSCVHRPARGRARRRPVCPSSVQTKSSVQRIAAMAAARLGVAGAGCRDRPTSRARLPRCRSATWSALLATNATRRMPPGCSQPGSAIAVEKAEQFGPRRLPAQRPRRLAERLRSILRRRPGPGVQRGEQVRHHHQPVHLAEQRRDQLLRAPQSHIGVVALAASAPSRPPD